MQRIADERNPSASTDERLRVRFASETRMYPAMRKTLFLLVSATVCVAGCRGPNPFGRFVQVTKDNTDNLPAIEAPEQRLATAKPRAELDSQPGMMGSGSDLDVAQSQNQSPAATRTVSMRGPSEASTIQTASAETATPERRTLSDRSASDTSDGNQSEAATVAQNAMNDGNLSDEQLQEIMNGLGNMRPDLRQALQQVMAETSRNASQTTQPNGIDIAGNLNQLPDLPEAKNTTPENPPVRIAAQQTTDSANEESNNADAVAVEAGNEASGLVTTEVESAVPTEATASNDGASDPLVKPVSASRTEDDPSMVSRAAVDSSLSIDVDPATLTGQLSDQVLYDSLIQRLTQPVAGESEAERASRLTRLRYLRVLSGDPDRAVEPIEGLPKAEQEFLRYQLLGLWSLIDPQGHPVASRRFTAALPHIREAGKFAAAATDSLEVRSLSFCTEIESYGQIKTFSGNRFDSGQQVILYCEVENFTVSKKEGGFETHLQGSYDIFNDSNEKVVSQLLPADQQVSSNYLRDYFIAYQMHLPAQLAPGTYRMQLTMEDVAGKKYGQASIPFEVAE